MRWRQLERWSPYAVGIGIGILSWIAFLLSDKGIGCSTAFSHVSGMIERLFRGSRGLTKHYYKRYPPLVTWDVMLLIGVVGILIGAGLFAAAYPTLESLILPRGNFGSITIPDLLKVNAWVVVIPVAIVLIGFLVWMERAGL